MKKCVQMYLYTQPNTWFVCGRRNLAGLPILATKTSGFSREVAHSHIHSRYNLRISPLWWKLWNTLYLLFSVLSKDYTVVRRHPLQDSKTVKENNRHLIIVSHILRRDKNTSLSKLVLLQDSKFHLPFNPDLSEKNEVSSQLQCLWT